MSHVTIPDQDSYVEYLSQTGTGPYTVPFAVFEKADIAVMVGGAEIALSGFSFAETSSTSGGYQTGEITLGVAAAAQDILIWRRVNPKRTTDFGVGPLSVNALNSALDRIHAQLQDNQRDLDRALKLPFGEEAMDDQVADMLALGEIIPEIEQVADIDAEVVITAGLASDIAALAAVADSLPAIADQIGGTRNLRSYNADGDGTDDKTAIDNWFAAVTAPAAASETIVATLKAGYVPAGRYKATGGTTMTSTGYGVSLYGDGMTSQLEDVTFAPVDPFWAVRDLTFTSASSATDPTDAAIILDSSANGGRASNLFIQRRAIGIWSKDVTSTAGFYGIDIHRNDIAAKIENTGGLDIGGFDFNSGRIGMEFTGGGEVKLNHGRMLTNSEYGFKIVGDSTHIPIESYFHQLTLGNNGLNARTYSITGIVTHSAGARIEVTLSANHNLGRGQPRINLTGTGVVGYDGVNTYVYDITAANKVVLDLPYVSNATGTLQADGWDLWIESQGGPQFARDFWFIGGNINTTGIDGGHNINFIGTRLKSQIYLGATQQVNRLLIIRNGMGTYAGNDSDASNAERNKDIPVMGPGSLLGWGEIGMFLPGTPGGWGAASGALGVGMRAPYYAGGLNTQNEPAHLNYVLVFDNKIGLKSNGVTYTITGDTWDTDAADGFVFNDAIITGSTISSGPGTSQSSTWVMSGGQFIHKRNSTQYIVGEDAASDLRFVSGGAVGVGTEQLRINASSGLLGRHYRPMVNNTYDLGSASSQSFRDIFSQNAVTVTSDERTKDMIGDFPEEWLDAWGEVQWVRFKLKTSIAEKGANARWHCGLIAQRVHAAFARHGINAMEIGLVGWDSWPEQRDTREVLVVHEDGEQELVEEEVIRPAGEEWKIRYSEAEALEAAWVRRELSRMKKAA